MWPDWGSTARADLAGLGSIGLINLESSSVWAGGAHAIDLVSKTQHWKRFVRGFKENIHILYIKLKENKFPIQILLPSVYLFILFQAQ